MFKLDLASTICEIRRQLCPPGRVGADGLVSGIVFNAHLWLHQYGTGLERRTDLRVLLCGNTSVFVDVRRSVQPFHETPWSAWVNTCNHDSCWATDGLRVISSTYFEMAEEINSDVPPASLCDLSSLGHLGPPWQLVRCRMERDADDPNNYRRVLCEVRFDPAEK